MMKNLLGAYNTHMLTLWVLGGMGFTLWLKWEVEQDRLEMAGLWQKVWVSTF